MIFGLWIQKTFPQTYNLYLKVFIPISHRVT